MSFKFENLLIWQKSMDLGEQMNILSKGFPKEEIYNLSSQLRRASDSVASIALSPPPLHAYMHIRAGTIKISIVFFIRFYFYKEILYTRHARAWISNLISDAKSWDFWGENFEKNLNLIAVCTNICYFIW